MPAGQKVKVIAIDGGRSLRSRLMAMGLCKGCTCSVIAGGCGGPVLIAVGDCRLSLGRGQARQIIVQADGIVIVPMKKSGLYEGEEVEVRLFK